MITDKDRELFVKLQRWKGMTMREIQADVLKPLYRPLDWWPEDLNAPWQLLLTRRASPCKCGGKSRAPSNLVQYLEMCTTCGKKFGETPTWNE